MNDIKLFINGDGFILDNAGEKYLIDATGVVKTSSDTDGLEETTFDIVVQALLDNAASTIITLQNIVQTEMENFE